METVVTFALPESASPSRYWVMDILKRHPVGSGDDAALDMRRAGCTEMRSAVVAREAVLVFKWGESLVPGGMEPAEYVKRWTTYAGWPHRIDDNPTPTAIKITSMVTYVPDINGRPCTPPNQPTA